jgi:hypothetical protein
MSDTTKWQIGYFVMFWLGYLLGHFGEWLLGVLTWIVMIVGIIWSNKKEKSK